MTEVLGAVLATALVATLLAREALVTGLIRTSHAARLRLSVSIAVLAVAFSTVVIIHLTSLLTT